jgi:hypothetical protein
MLNPNVYQPSEAAVALPQPFSMRYGTVNSDGSGEETVRVDTPFCTARSHSEVF